MKKITLILLSAIFVVGSFFYLYAAEAVDSLVSPFPERVHAHDQWMRVFIKVGNNYVGDKDDPNKPFDAQWRPVFDYPEKLGSGYTADEASAISTELEHYLKSANMYDQDSDMYILSNQGARDIGLGNNNVQYSEWVRNIPIKTTTKNTDLVSIFGKAFTVPPGNWSKINPYIAHSKSPGTVVWDGKKFYYSISESEIDGAKRGIVNIKDNSGAHRAFVNPSVSAVGYGELHMYFPYNTMFSEYTPVIISQVEVGKKAYGYVNVVNMAPWSTVPAKTKFRLYIEKQGEEPQLADIQDLAIGPCNTKKVGFEFSVPEGQFKLILTTNMYWDGGWKNEPLATMNVVDETKVVSEPESEYARNKIERTLYADKPQQQEEQQQPSNLAVTNLQLLDQNGNPAHGFVEVNKSYKLKANFQSTFDQAGSAKIRFYKKREAGWMELVDEKTVQFSPNGTTEKKWDYTGMSENVSLVATVSYKWSSAGDAWVEELFDSLEEESTYLDNKMELSTEFTDVPVGPPTPESYSYSLYYHPVKEVVTPVYEKVWTLKTNPGWVMIETEPPKTRARLVR